MCLSGNNTLEALLSFGLWPQRKEKRRARFLFFYCFAAAAVVPVLDPANDPLVLARFLWGPSFFPMWSMTVSSAFLGPGNAVVTFWWSCCCSIDRSLIICQRLPLWLYCSQLTLTTTTCHPPLHPCDWIGVEWREINEKIEILSWGELY